MDEGTKAIVASNLTLAYYQVPVSKFGGTAPRTLTVNEDPVKVILPEVLAVYRAVLEALESEGKAEPEGREVVSQE